MLHAQHILNRESTLIVVGPRGIESRFKATAECLFPGSTQKKLPFEMRFFEHVTAVPFDWRGLSCSAVDVSHPSGAPSHGLRFDYQGKSISYSGDTEWVDALIGLSEGADLHINECFAFNSALRYHTSWSVLKDKLSRLRAKRIILTHMGEDMLSRLNMIEAPNVSFARDGLVVEI
jgi:ribonuclease BN (tRNA processing enzyme)